MKRFITAAAIQMEILPLDISTNLQKAEYLLSQAAQENKLDLVVFPEDFITGPIPHNLEYAQSETCESIRFFKTLAQKYRTHIACGSFIKEVGDKYFNTAILINQNGEIILEYRKNNLWIPERRMLTAGSELPVVKTSIGTIGIIICWDLAFPEACRQLAKQGAEIICCPSYWTREDCGALLKKYPDIDIEATMIDTLCAARSLENECLLIYANGAKEASIFLKTKKITLNQVGRSQICAPLYGCVKRIDDNAEGYITYTYDRHIAKDAEGNYKIRRDIGSPQL